MLQSRAMSAVGRSRNGRFVKNDRISGISGLEGLADGPQLIAPHPKLIV